MQITYLEISGFKSLRDVSISLHPLTIFVGANGSGKSNLLEALRVLQGLSLGLTVTETLAGVTRPGVQWDGIRGGAENAPTRLEDGADDQLTIRVEGRIEDDKWETVSFQSELERGDGTEETTWRVTNEEFLCCGDEKTRCKLTRRLEKTDDGHRKEHWRFESSSGQISEGKRSSDDLIRQATSVLLSEADRIWDEFAVEDAFGAGTREHAEEFRHCRDLLKSELAEQFRSFRLYRLLPDNLRQAWPDSWTELDERGEGLGPVVRQVIEDDANRQVLLDWLTELLPLQVSDIRVVEPSPGKFSVQLVERGDEQGTGTVRPADVLSDGTLHFLGLLAALIGAGGAKPANGVSRLVGLEDIEENLHPSRLNTLVEFLDRMTSRELEPEDAAELQVIATTHAPTVLDAVDRQDFERVIYFWRDSETLETKAKQLSEFSNLDRIVDGGIPLGELHEEDWFAGEVE